jgi:carboxyl-terminal processing protease
MDDGKGELSAGRGCRNGAPISKEVGMAGRILAILLLAAPAATADTKKAKAYVQEVRRHLLESYVDRDKLSAERLQKAGLSGLAQALKDRQYESLSEEAREAVRSAKSVEAALDALASHVDDGFDFVKLADWATKAMVKDAGDPYARILNAEEFNKLLKMLQGGSREDSLGMSVRPDTGEVAYVQYGYPAYDEGIEIGDTVLEVNGKAVQGRTPDELNEMLRLTATLEVKVTRPGHPKPYLFRIEPRKTQVKDVRFEYLGEGIGYLRMTIFDLKLSSEVKKALQELQKSGMKALILDLRHNPGGALPASTAVADLLLGQGLVITTTESKYKPSLGGIELPGVGGDQTFKTTKKSDFEEMPLVVLINRASASASELLSGALQDHKRGKLIGETTYGKGVGQSPIFLNSVMQERYLYLTVMTYKLPSGRSIHGTGVVPDVEFKDEKVAPDKFAEIWRVRTSGALQAYVEKNWGDALRRLGKNDGFDSSRYPGFDALYGSLKTKLSKDEVRAELRRAVRRHTERTDGTVWVCDLETDLQLQRGLVELLDVLGK